MPTTLIAYNDQQRALAKRRDTRAGLKDTSVRCDQILYFLAFFGILNRQKLRGRHDCSVSFKQHRNTGKQK